MSFEEAKTSHEWVWGRGSGGGEPEPEATEEVGPIRARRGRHGLEVSPSGLLDEPVTDGDFVAGVGDRGRRRVDSGAGR